MTMTENVFDDAARRRLGEDYPLQPVPLSHRLADHPLFSTEALTALARRMDPVDILSNMADLPVEVRPEGVHEISTDASAVIASIRDKCSWMVFRHVQNDPEYGALLES